jgi:multiple sugar transport system permease protein
VNGKRTSLVISRALSYALLIFLVAMCLIPFVVLLINATRNHADIQRGFSFVPSSQFFVNLKNLMNDPNLPVLRGILNSLTVSGLTALCATYFSALTAYAIHAYDFRLRKIAYSFILMVMIVPTQVSALGFLRMMVRLNWANSFWPLILPAIASPVVFFFMKQYMEAVLPVEVVEASRIDGAGEFFTFNRIVLPMMKPAIAVQAIFTFVSSWNNFFMPALLLKSQDKKTLPLLIAQLRSADFMKFDMGKVYMMITVAIVPILIVYLFLSKFIVRGVTLGSVKG